MLTLRNNDFKRWEIATNFKQQSKGKLYKYNLA